MDAFYASVEQRDDPSLRGKPLIVGGDGKRGVVAAASYEVRKFGVRSAMPVKRALELCPQAICVKPRIAHYRAVSRQVFAIFHEFTPLVQGLSLDEAYLDVTQSQLLHGSAVDIARTIKARIRDRTQLGASVGVAPNRLVAKIASDVDKPDGLTVVTPEGIHAFLDPLSVRRLPGLGRKAGEKVEAAGLRTLGQLRAAPQSVLYPLFGRHAQRMRDRAAGIDDRPVDPDHDEKSISAEKTFHDDVADPAVLQGELAQLADKATARLRAKQLAAGCVGVKIRRHDFATFTRQRRFEPAASDGRTLAGIARDLLAQWLSENPGARLRLIGMGVSELAPAAQFDLFAAPGASSVATALDAALDGIRAKFGTNALRRASNLKG